MNEAMVENYLVNRVEELGGISAKMTIKGRRGWPDRLVVMPGGQIALVELKRPKRGQWSAAQKELFIRLGRLGVNVVRLNSPEEIDGFIDGMHLKYTHKRLWGASANDVDDID